MILYGLSSILKKVHFCLLKVSPDTTTAFFPLLFATSQ